MHLQLKTFFKGVPFLILGAFLSPFPVAGAPASAIAKGIGASTKTVTKAIGGSIEKKKNHASASDLHKIIGSFDAKESKYYEAIVSAFADIFIHFNIQFGYLLDARILDCHINKAMYKLALDSVSKIFHGFRYFVENFEELPKEISKEFIIQCFLIGESKGGFFDKIRSKLPKIIFGKSLGKQLKHTDSENDVSTQEIFEMPMVKTNDDKIYCTNSKSSEEMEKFLYRYIFDHEDIPDSSSG